MRLALVVGGVWVTAAVLLMVVAGRAVRAVHREDGNATVPHRS